MTETVETVIARAMVWADEPFEITDLGHELKQASRIIAALDAAGFSIVPKEPPPGLLISMAMRHNHAFLFAPQTVGGVRVGSGVPPEYRENVLSSMRQLHEEVVGTGFWSPGRDAGYVENFDRAMLAAAREPSP